MSQQREKDILDFIRNYIRRNKISPSVREICEGMGIRSTSTVHRYLHRLEENGKLEVNSGKKRAIFIKESYMQQGIPVVAQIKPETTVLEPKNIQSYYRISSVQKHQNPLFAFQLRKDYPEYCILKTDMLIAESDSVSADKKLTVFLTEDGFPEITDKMPPEENTVVGSVIMVIRSFE